MMTRKRTLLLTGFFMAAVILMTAQAAMAETVVFTANLLAGNEPNGVGSGEQNASGQSTMTFAITRDASNNITAANATFQWTLTGFPPTSILILSHIHSGAAGVNGPVVIDSGLTPGTAIAMTSGGASVTRSGLLVSPTLMGQILANPAAFYFNSHTTANPGGAARGQLAPQQAATPPGSTVPTLSQWGAIIMGLLIVATGLFFVVARSRAAASVGSIESMMPDRPTIEWQRYFKTAVVVEAVTGITLAALSAYVTPTDVMGALTSGLIVAFIVQMFLPNRQQ